MSLETGLVRSFLLAFLGLAVLGSKAGAQTAPAWREVLPSKVEAFDSTLFGSILVQFKAGNFAVDSETGKHLWSRPDVNHYALVTGTPFAIFKTAGGLTVADVETGQDRWRLASLGFSSVKGMVHIASAGLLLVYGQTADSTHTLTAAKYESGEILWKQTALFIDPLLAPKAAKMNYRTYLADTDKTVILDPSDDGLVRLDLQTGRVIWRIPEAGLDSKDDDVGLSVHDGRVLVAYKKKLLAISQDDGKVLWSRQENFPTPVFQTALTSHGFLVRGAYNLDNKGHASWHPYLAMLNAATGATIWTNEKTKFRGRSSFLVEKDTAVIALEEGIATFDLSTGQTTNTVPMAEFGGGESPCCLERLDDGRLGLWSSQNLRLFDPSGKQVYAVFLKAPGASFMAKLATVAAAVAATYAGAALAGPGGFYNVYSAGSILTDKFKASTNAQNYGYIFTEEAGADADRFALVRIDKNNGKEAGRLKFTDRSPSFRLDPSTTAAVVIDNGVIFGLRFNQANNGFAVPAPTTGDTPTPAPAPAAGSAAASRSDPGPSVAGAPVPPPPVAPPAPLSPASVAPTDAPAPAVASAPSTDSAAPAQVETPMPSPEPVRATPPTTAVPPVAPNVRVTSSAAPNAPLGVATTFSGGIDPTASAALPTEIGPALEAGVRSEKEEDWSAALRHYENAGRIDPSMTVFIDSAIARVKSQMGTAGADALRRAKQYDALGRANDAITWYLRALAALPATSPDRSAAEKRLAALKASQ